MANAQTSAEIAAELSADILEHPRRLEQYERSLVATVIIVARRRPELTQRAAELVRNVIGEQCNV
jgi:hypothetical protein